MITEAQAAILREHISEVSMLSEDWAIADSRNESRRKEKAYYDLERAERNMSNYIDWLTE